MAVTFVVVPQWQGSGSPRRLQLSDGAAAIRAGLPAAAVRDVEVPGEAGEARGAGVAGYSVLQRIHDHHARLLADTEEVAITIGGDCGVELAAIGHATRRARRDLAIVWLDAHGDLNTPASSPSGAFHGMVLRAVLGEGAPGLVSEPAATPRPAQVVLAGTRSFDPAERAYVDAHGVRLIAPADFRAEALVAAVEATGASSVFIHVDLDVLDPGELHGIGCPEPQGVSAEALVASIAALRRRYRLTGAGITEFTPWSVAEATRDLATIRRILGALAVDA
ncbi:MAG TPA: arginase family protein [Kofleriaceae bacterium]|jgi:arginase